MDQPANILSRIARSAGEVVAETLWPTRCALCDVPGEVLCASCRRALPYLDWWRACRRCGSAFGFVQCGTCNPVALAQIGFERLPFSGCASATMFDNDSGRVVRVYKDQGERRLAGEMADIMARYASPDWTYEGVTFIPATRRAQRRRGFDHAELLAREVAGRLGVGLAKTLARPQVRDQRSLSGSERIANLAHAFRADGDEVEGRRLLLVDDVFTTGSTLCAAAAALVDAGAAAVYCLTFARV